VELGSHRASWNGASSPAVPFFTKQGRAKWWPHSLTKATPDKYDNNNIHDNLVKRAPLDDDRPPLRLRGGNGDISDDIQIDNDQNNGQITITPTNARKRRAGESPPGTVPANIIAENLAIEGHVNDCKLFLQDMQTATKIGKKWLQGIEDYIAKIQTCCNSIALEAAVTAGKYQEAKDVASEANRRLEACLSSSNTDSNAQTRRLYVPTVKSQEQVAEDDCMTVVVPTSQSAPKRPVRERLGDFPPLDGQTANNKKGDKRRAKTAKLTSERNRAAKMKPVRPAFIIDGKENSLKLEEIWQVVSAKTANPKLDSCRRTAEGNFVLTSSDKATTDAIRSISEGLSVREQGPRKPRLRFKGIPSEYSAEFVADTIIK